MVLIPLSVVLLAACGQQIAGTSASVSNVGSAQAPASPEGTLAPTARPTVTATTDATRTVTASATMREKATPPKASPSTTTVTAVPAEPQTITQTPPPVVVVPAPRVTITEDPSTVYVPRGSSAADDQVAADWLTAEVMVGSWIPQLSSNTDSDSAMAKYNGLSANYSGVFMVSSNDFTSFRRGGYYVTMVAIPFGTSAEANAWCDAQGFQADDCLAKRLSHTDGPDGSTVERN